MVAGRELSVNSTVTLGAHTTWSAETYKPTFSHWGGWVFLLLVMKIQFTSGGEGIVDHSLRHRAKISVKKNKKNKKNKNLLALAIQIKPLQISRLKCQYET